MPVPASHLLVFSLLLFAIGIRFIVDPKAAQRTFGLLGQLKGYELHAIIGVRDLWLAGMPRLTSTLRSDVEGPA